MLFFLSKEIVRQALMFFQAFSSPLLIGPDVIAAVSHFFTTSHLLPGTNSFFLALIPKFQSINTFSYCRSISLLNFTYKIISKILATRLSTILPLLISNHHVAFVKGRSIHEHAALANELFQKLRTKVSDGAICMKLDISKAFDKLHWSFLFKALDFFEFPPRWINWIKELICTSRGSVLINKSPRGSLVLHVAFDKVTHYLRIYSSLPKRFSIRIWKVSSGKGL